MAGEREREKDRESEREREREREREAKKAKYYDIPPASEGCDVFLFKQLLLAAFVT